MSNRIALMVRGLPSIGIEEAVERFGKYYPQPTSGVFHQSPSFVGQINDNNVSFFNAKTKGYSGGQGLSKQSIGDLRKLKQDFEEYIQANPNVYTNEPTSKSRAKLYRRIGFQDLPDSSQVLDARRIADLDLPYVKEIDKLIYDKLGEGQTPSIFYSSNGKVISSQRLRSSTFLSTLRNGNVDNLIGDVNYALDLKEKNKRKLRGVFDSTDITKLDPIKFVADNFRPPSNPELEAVSYRRLNGRPQRFSQIQEWARLAGLGDITPENARTISTLHRDHEFQSRRTT